MVNGLFILVVLSTLFVLIIKQASRFVWLISSVILSLIVLKYGISSSILQVSILIILAAFALGSIEPLRKNLLTKFLFKIAKKSMPVMSKTEREALEAGTVTWEGDLFSGAPDFNVLLSLPTTKLTKEEQAFIDGPTTALCRMINDWDITHNLMDLPEEIWQFIKDNGFLGMIIPKRYGGLEFSATAQMSVIVKLYGLSISVATTVSVPNSLGPAELLLKYGTNEQKDYYLPRLANGREIPCFALTGPTAGSDAASIPDKGIVSYQSHNGTKVLGIKLTWNKRYITLCPVATVIGLAFRLYDPENLLGDTYDLGISCALIPADTKGVISGRRHFPLNIAFMNGPTQGNNVFVPIDCLIGGAKMAGHGWRMLMECLSAGRAISLPSSASGGAQAVALASGAYARVRKQFNQPISKFEGIEEPLARIAGHTYIIDAALTMAAAAIDQGEKPAVAGAILKYHTTEFARLIALDAMDIHGGKGICLGPNNYIGRGYQGSPIGITVEGANILSRSLIIFGQGALRCHPYVFKEMESIKSNDLSGFDKAIWGHCSFVFANFAKSILFSITDAHFSNSPSGDTRRYYQLINRYSSNLAFLADFSMIKLGGELKRKEKISARLGDVLSNLYLVSAVLKRFHEDGELISDLPILNWCCQQLFYKCEEAIFGIIANFPGRISRLVLKIILLPLGQKRNKPSDKLGHELATLLTVPSSARKRLSRLTFYEAIENCPLGCLEEAFNKICDVEELDKIVLKAVKLRKINKDTKFDQIIEALEQHLISKDESVRLLEAESLRQKVIAVDDFSNLELMNKSKNKQRSGKK